jgi:hypothetical protein
MSREPLSGFPTLDIEYPIESDKRTALDKPYITQLLPTRYSINITNTFSGYQYKKWWMYVYEVDIWLNIHSVYAGVRQIANWIFSWCMQGSGGLLTGYSFDVWMGQVDCQPNIHLVYAGVRWITNWIFIIWARWIGIEYSIVRMIGLGGSELHIQ